MSDFDDLVLWSEGKKETKEVEKVVSLGVQIQQTAQLVAQRVNSARMVALYKLAAKVDDKLLENIDILDPEQLMRLMGRLEDKIHDTSGRILQVDKNNKSTGVQINMMNQMTGQPTSVSPGPTVSPLSQGSRERVLKFLQGANALGKSDTIETTSVSIVGVKVNE